MLKGYLKFGGSYANTLNLCNQYKQPLIARVMTTSDKNDSGWISNSELALNINLDWTSTDRNRMPTIAEFPAYRKNWQPFYEIPDRNIYLTSTQNEAVNYGHPYDPYVMSRMLYFHASQDSDTLLTHSGTPTQLIAGIARRYMTETGQTDKLAWFDYHWLQSPFRMPDDVAAQIAIKEIQFIDRLKLPNFKYSCHTNISVHTLECLPILIEAIKHYTSAPIIFNEVSFNALDENLMTGTLQVLKDNGILAAIIYNGPRGMAVELSPAQMDAFFNFS